MKLLKHEEGQGPTWTEDEWINASIIKLKVAAFKNVMALKYVDVWIMHIYNYTFIIFIINRKNLDEIKFYFQNTSILFRKSDYYIDD